MQWTGRYVHINYLHQGIERKPEKKIKKFSDCKKNIQQSNSYVTGALKEKEIDWGRKKYWRNISQNFSKPDEKISTHRHKKLNKPQEK